MASVENLIELSKAFDSFFKRARNRKRIMANNRRMARRNEKIMEPATREMLDYITTEVQKGLPKLKSGKASAIKRMVDWDHIEEQAALIIKPAMLEVLAEGGRSIVERKIVKQERFDPIGVAAVDWSSKHSATLVTEITKAQRTTIGSFVTKGLDAGKSIPTIMRELRPTVGILEKHMGTIATARVKMIAEGVPAAKIASRTDRMARHYHHLRINTIARTETRRALDEGALQGYGQMGIGKVDRIEDPDCCGYCARVMAGGPYTMERARSFGFHPNCEGVWVAAVGEKIKPPPKIPKVMPERPGVAPKWRPAKTIAEAEKWGKQYGIEGIVAEGKSLTLREWNLIAREMSKLPDDLLRKIKAAGGKMDLVVNSGITVHPAFKQYKGKTPRGWDTGTWDNVPGAGGTRANPKTVIVANKTQTGHGCVNLTLHEYGHTVDAVYRKGWTNLSESTKWKQIWKTNGNKGLIESPYEIQFAEEYWAESFGEFFDTPGHGFLPKNVITYFNNLFKGGG